MIRLVAKSHEEFSWILCDEWESSRDHFLQLDYVIEGTPCIGTTSYPE